MEKIFHPFGEGIERGFVVEIEVIGIGPDSIVGLVAILAGGQIGAAYQQGASGRPNGAAQALDLPRFPYMQKEDFVIAL